MLNTVRRAAAIGSRTEVWPRKVRNVSLIGHEYRRGAMGPAEIEREALEAFEQGAPGIFFFNHDTWTTLGRLGFRDELALRVRAGLVAGLREGPKITFADWYPSIAERKTQRETFRPLVVERGEEGRADGMAVVSVTNTFPQPVTVRLAAASPAENGEAWLVSPRERTSAISARGRSEFSFQVTGPGGSRAFDVEFSAGDEVVFRHRLPVRVVPVFRCRKAVGGRQDGERDLEALGEALLAAGPRVRLGPAGERGVWEFAVGYDDAELWVVGIHPGIERPKQSAEPGNQESRQGERGPRLQILVDPKGDEREFREFAVTLNGEKSEALWRYDSFVGHFVRNRKWSGEWEAWAKSRQGGAVVVLRIPFKTLGSEPETGPVWRLNVAGYSARDGNGTITRVWSGSSKDLRDVKAFGGLVFGEPEE